MHPRERPSILDDEARFQALAEAAPVMVWQAGPDKLCTYFNRNWLEFTGRSMEQELGNGWAEGVHPEDIDRCLTVYSGAFDRREPFEMDYRLRRRDGEYRWILGRAVPIFERGTTFAGYIGSCIDITERKEAETALAESEMRFRLAAETTSDVIWDWEVASNRISWGANFEETVGYPPQEVSPVPAATMEEAWAPWDRYIHPDDRKRVQETFAAALASRSPVWTEEFRFLRPDGTAWFVERDRFIYGAAGKLERIVGSIKDITARKEAEQALANNEQRFRALAETAPSIIWTAAFDGTITFHNRQWLEFTGIAPEDNARDWPALVLHPEDRERCIAAWSKSLEQGTPYEIEVRNRRHDGVYRWFLTRATPVRDETGRIVEWFGSSTDIQRQKEIERALRDKEERLRLATNAARLGVFEWDLETDEAVWENDRMYEIFGRSRAEGVLTADEFLGHIVVPKHVERVRQAIARAKVPGNSLHLICRIRGPGDSRRWIEVSGRFEFSESGVPGRLVGVIADVTERQEAKGRLELLLAELNHRVKNTLATVKAVASQTQRFNLDPSQFVENFNGRIQALARAHTLLTHTRWGGADLRTLIHDQLVVDGAARANLAGPEVLLDSSLALNLGLVLHELATNAGKYGALSVPEGRLDVAWAVPARGRRRKLELRWTESGGPVVEPPARTGFGTVLIEHGLKGALGGVTNLDFRPSGLVCRIKVPLAEESEDSRTGTEG